MSHPVGGEAVHGSSGRCEPCQFAWSSWAAAEFAGCRKEARSLAAHRKLTGSTSIVYSTWLSRGSGLAECHTFASSSGVAAFSSKW